MELTKENFKHMVKQIRRKEGAMKCEVSNCGARAIHPLVHRQGGSIKSVILCERHFQYSELLILGEDLSLYDLD
jgi:hypothetical protein